MLLEAVPRIRLHLRLRLEQQALQGSHLNLQLDYIYRQERQLFLEMELLRYLNFIHISGPHLHLVLELQTTQSSTQTLELLMVLVLLQLVMKQQFFIRISEMHLQMEAELLHLRKRALSLELYQLMEMVLHHQNNCELSLELVLHQDSLTHLHHSDTGKSELLTEMVEPQLTTKPSAFTPLQGLQVEKEMVLQVPLRSKPLLEQQAGLVKAPIHQMAYTSLQEMQVVTVAVIRLHQSSLHILELLLALGLEIQTTQFFIQISEQLRVLALLLQVTQQLGCILLHVQQMEQEAVQKVHHHLRLRSELQVRQAKAQMRQMAYTQRQEAQQGQGLEVKALKNSRFSLELLLQQEMQHKLQLENTRRQEERLLLVAQPLAIPLLACIRHQELRQEQEQVVQVI